MLLRNIIIWILTSLLRRADPDFDKRLTAFETAKVSTEQTEKETTAAIAKDQSTIAADRVEQAVVEQKEQQLEADAGAIANQRKDLRDEAEKNPPVRPSDDDLLSGPLPGSGMQNR
jgi:hypothetical protein